MDVLLNSPHASPHNISIYIILKLSFLFLLDQIKKYLMRRFSTMRTITRIGKR